MEIYSIERLKSFDSKRIAYLFMNNYLKNQRNSPTKQVFHVEQVLKELTENIPKLGLERALEIDKFIKEETNKHSQKEYFAETAGRLIPCVRYYVSEIKNKVMNKKW